MRTRLALWLVLLAATPAHAQDLPAGWSRVARVMGGTPTAAACSPSTAFLRDWSGAVTSFDGTAGARLPLRTESAYGRSIAVDGTGHPMIVTEDGVVTWNGSTWEVAPIVWPGRESEIGGLAAVDATHGYFVTNGAIGARDGDHFSLYDAGTWRRLDAIAARSPSDLWAVGQGGTVMHWDGAPWTRERARTDAWLHGVALGASDVWAWSSSAIFHRDDRGWPASAMGSPVGTLVAVVAARDAVFAVGEQGVARWSSGAWTPDLPASALGPYASFAATCATDRSLVVVLSSGDVLVRAL